MKIIGVNKPVGSYVDDSKSTFICELSFEEMERVHNFIHGGYDCVIDKFKQSDLSGLIDRIEQAQIAENNLEGILRSHNDLTNYITKARESKGSSK
jgi:hypothetical protein